MLRILLSLSLPLTASAAVEPFNNTRTVNMVTNVVYDCERVDRAECCMDAQQLIPGQKNL
jgi:hypothetical protein